MSGEDKNLEQVRVREAQPSEESHILVEEEEPQIVVVLTQVFCHNGHNMVGLSEESFDGHPGISFWVKGSGQEGEVVVSPVHGDHAKRGPDFPKGSKLSLCCPVCKEELPELTKCKCHEDGRLRKLFLTPRMDEAHLMAVCDIMGCPLSRVIDSYEMFSEFIEGNIGD